MRLRRYIPGGGLLDNLVPMLEQKTMRKGTVFQDGQCAALSSFRVFNVRMGLRSLQYTHGSSHCFCLVAVSEQLGCGTPALNVMEIRDQRQANVSKQRTLLADVDVAKCALRHSLYHMTGKCFSSRNGLQQEC